MKIKHYFCLLSCIWLGIILPAYSIEQSTTIQQADSKNSTPESFITGAGAHFSWIIFDSLKSDLERVAGRRIVLYGKDSMLGQGCNAGIKSAKLSGPERETFGFVCCPLSAEEIAKEHLVVYPLALEPILILTHKSNPVSNLTHTQIQAIFSGKITNWQEVGGKDQPIVVVTRLHCKKRPGHWKKILPSAKDFRQQRLNVSSADDMIQRVSDFPGAIGHVGATWIFESSDNVKHISVNGVAPTAGNLKTKAYPYFRQLSAVTNETPSINVLNIIKEVQTGSAFYRVAKRFELLPLNPPAK